VNLGTVGTELEEEGMVWLGVREWGGVGKTTCKKKLVFGGGGGGGGGGGLGGGVDPTRGEELRAGTRLRWFMFKDCAQIAAV